MVRRLTSRRREDERANSRKEVPPRLNIPAQVYGRAEVNTAVD